MRITSMSLNFRVSGLVSGYAAVVVTTLHSSVQSVAALSLVSLSALRGRAFGTITDAILENFRFDLASPTGFEPVLSP